MIGKKLPSLLGDFHNCLEIILRILNDRLYGHKKDWSEASGDDVLSITKGYAYCFFVY